MMPRFISPLRILAAVVTLCSFLTPVRASEKLPPSVYQRTVFLGDSITDGNTYPILVRDAIGDAKLDEMIAINAGIGGDTAAGMLARLDRDVLSRHPTLVTLSAGANDALRGVTPADYEKDVRAIASRLAAEHVPLILLTPNILGPKQQPKGQKNLDAYEAILRQVGHDDGLRVAEVSARQKEDLAAGHPQLAPDDLHPDYEGQRMIARAILDAMGYADLKVPARAHNRLSPGLIAVWAMQPAAPDAPKLTDASAASLEPDATWIRVQLPETSPPPSSDTPSGRWLDDNRLMGMCTGTLRDKGNSFHGVATVHSDTAKTMRLHTGGELSEIWFNGKKIYQNDDRHGFHAGRESVDAQLQAGDNQIVITTGPIFFLSITDGAFWP